MAVRKRRLTSRDKWKAKVWYRIIADEAFKNFELGETPAAEPSLVVGRRVEALAGEIFNNPRLNHIKLIFEVKNVSGNDAHAEVIGYELLRAYLGSIVRRGRKKIELIKDFETKDGKKVRVKAVCITAGRAHTSQAEAIRKIMAEVLAEEVPKRDFVQLIKDAVAYVLQSIMAEKAKKVYPIANMEIRKIELV